ncbi:MAG: ComF family protein [Pseudomonadota bacterium]
MGRRDRVLHSAIQTALNAIYPARCLGCGVVVDGALGLCGSCWRETPFIGGMVCDSCGVPLPGEATEEIVQCDACIAEPPLWSRGRAALQYRDLTRKLILGFKHGDRIELAEPAAAWLAQAARPILQPDMLIAPIPLHRWRLAKRRYNQSALLARALSKLTGHEVCLDLLTRPVATPSLDGKSRSERAATLLGAIAVQPRRADLIKGRKVLLVDDVLTTGATFTDATRACLEAGAEEVCVLALARVTHET